MKIISNLKKSLLATAIAVAIIACEVEDPFVDRTVSPVLLVFEGVPGYLAGGGLTSTPTIRKDITPANAMEPVEIAVHIYELDKTGLLDHTIGIDSIPVSGLVLKFSKRDGSLPIEVTSNDLGRAAVTTTWEDLGIADPASLATQVNEINIGVTWKGEYKGQSFTRYSQVQFKVN